MKKGFKKFFKTTLLSLVAVLCLSGCQKNASSEEFLEENRIVETTEKDVESTETPIIKIDIDVTQCTYAAIPDDNGKYSIKNLNTGITVIEPKYDYIHNSSTFPYAQVMNDGKSGVINYTTGEELIPTEHEKIDINDNYITASNIDGSYLVLELATGEKFNIEKNEYFSLKVINSKYAIIYQYISTDTCQYIGMGILNWKTNEVILEPYYHYVSVESSEERYVVIANQNDEFGVFDLKNCKEVLPTIYEAVWIEEDEALGRFISIAGKDKWVNLKTSKVILEKDCIAWEDNYASVKDGDKWYIINRTNKKRLFKKQCEVLGSPITDTFAYIRIDGKDGIIDWKNNKEYITDANFDLFSNCTYVALEDNNKYGVINYETGENTTDFKYDSIRQYYGTRYAEVHIAEKIGIIDYTTGEEILKPISCKRIILEGDTFAKIYLENGEVQIINYHTGEVLFEIKDDQQKDIIIFPQSEKTESIVGSVFCYCINNKWLLKYWNFYRIYIDKNQQKI